MDNVMFLPVRIEDLLEMIKECVRDALVVKPQVDSKEEVPEDLLTIEDIQKVFKVSKVTVHKWKKKGLLPFYKMNRKVYFKKSEVIDAMQHKKRKLEV